MSPKDFLTITEVSDDTGIPVATLRRYRAQNIGPESFRIAGRGVVYSRQSLDDWIAAQMASTVRGGR
jgi:predicted DNA-binding transcriptional regulator AlpA